jgi:glycogen operon protein
MFLNGHGIRGRDRRGQPITDENFLLYFNAHDEGVTFELPSAEYGHRWDAVIDTTTADEPDAEFEAGDSVTLAGRSVLVLRAAS